MNDYVIDTNVWAMIDKSPSSLTSTEIKCVENCIEWLSDFISSQDRLIIDWSYKILQEYRKNIPKGGLAEQWLNKLETQPRIKLVEHLVEFDNDGYAILPDPLTDAIPDKSDRKFIAITLIHQPTPPIVDATDTDWQKAKSKLDAFGIFVQELCQEYIDEKLKE